MQFLELILIIIVFLPACIRVSSDGADRGPASVNEYHYKIISYRERSIECRGFDSDDDVEGTLIESIPLGADGQAPINICGEELDKIGNGRIE